MEYIPEAGLDWATVPSFRYDFIVQFAAGRAAHARNFKPVDPSKNTDHTREWPGFAPWAITEYFGKLRSGFSYLKVLEELGTPDEIVNAQANILYVMGVMGHYLLEQAGKLGQGEKPVSDEARAFIEARLLEGGRMLGAIWLAAHRSAVPDTYLRAALLRRQATSAPAGAEKETP